MNARGPIDGCSAHGGLAWLLTAVVLVGCSAATGEGERRDDDSDATDVLAMDAADQPDGVVADDLGDFGDDARAEADTPGRPDATSEPDADRTPLVYLALGDSYTIGTALEPGERWPVVLTIELSDELGRLVNLRTVASNGWRTDTLANAIADQDPVGPFDLVSLLIGVNDQYWGGDLSAYETAFADVLETSVDLAGGDPCRTLVLSIPDWGATPAGAAARETIAEEIDAFNAVNREVSETVGVHYVDVTTVSREGAGDPALIASDGLHFSGAMHARWVELALPSARLAIRGECPATE